MTQWLFSRDTWVLPWSGFTPAIQRWRQRQQETPPPALGGLPRGCSSTAEVIKTIHAKRPACSTQGKQRTSILETEFKKPTTTKLLQGNEMNRQRMQATGYLLQIKHLAGLREAIQNHGLPWRGESACSWQRLPPHPHQKPTEGRPLACT